MRQGDRQKRNYIIIGLCAVVMIMAVGFAVFSQQLQINSTSEVISNWDIEITGIQSASPSGGDAYDINPPTYTPTTATFSTGLIAPGDSRIYQVEVSNLGSLAGEVSIASLSCGNNDAINCFATAMDDKLLNNNGGWASYSSSNIPRFFDIDEGNNDFSNVSFTIEPTEKHYVSVVVGYADVESQPVNTTANITLTLNYVQAAPRVPYTGTVYRFIDDSSDNIAGFPNWQNNVTDITDYRMGTDYTNLTPETDYYFKYTVANDIVTESYVCFVIDTERCLKGGVDECQEENGVCTYSGTPTVFNSNKSLIEAKQLWFEEQGRCSFSSGYASCLGDNNGHNRVEVMARSDGWVHAGKNFICYINPSGISNCGGG